MPAGKSTGRVWRRTFSSLQGGSPPGFGPAKLASYRRPFRADQVFVDRVDIVVSGKHGFHIDAVLHQPVQSKIEAVGIPGLDPQAMAVFMHTNLYCQSRLNQL